MKLKPSTIVFLLCFLYVFHQTQSTFLKSDTPLNLPVTLFDTSITGAATAAIASSGSSRDINKTSKFSPKIDHHIISQRILRDYLTEVFVPLFKGGSSKETANAKKQTVAKMNSYIDKVRKSFSSVVETPDNELPDFVSIVVWNPGNTVPGPASRSDDPGDGVDTALLNACNVKFKKQISRIKNALKLAQNKGDFDKFLDVWIDIAGTQMVVDEDWVKTTAKGNTFKIQVPTK